MLYEDDTTWKQSVSVEGKNGPIAGLIAFIQLTTYQIYTYTDIWLPLGCIIMYVVT